MSTSSGSDFPNSNPLSNSKIQTHQEIQQDKKDANYAALSSGQASPAYKKASEDRSYSAWAQMFPGGATKEQMTQFINNFLNMMVYEFKRSDEKWRQSQKRLKKVAQGEDPYD